MLVLWAESDLDLWQGPHYRLILGLVNAFEWSKDLKNVRAFFVFFNWLHAWIMVLLVAQEDMIE